ncbi:MAG: class I SAM-dependent methyltransferase, partial [Beijerinckiaceae bacterium]
KKYHRIVSIEMIEAVGEEYLDTYFSKIAQSLKDNGRVVIQAITIDADRFEAYRSDADFIQSYIFPGGFLPSEGLMVEKARAAGLSMIFKQKFGESYARTLMEWRKRFEHAWPEIEMLGFDERFRRIWNYYLSYCAAGFSGKLIDVGLYVFTANQNGGE